MSDDPIDGLEDYFDPKYGIVDSPVNRKAYRFVYAFLRQYQAEVPEVQLAMRMVYMARLSHWVSIGGVMTADDNFVPLMVVMQSELVDVAGMHQVDCGHDHLAEKPSEENELLSGADLNEAFMHSVESLFGDEALDPSKYEGLYIAPETKGEGGEEGTDTG